ncbi:MAG TPA: MFS transporter [Pseudomonadales bacterium]|nr:MFS transporter [Pseudomonadales bacterium]
MTAWRTWLLPAGATRDAPWILGARSLRAFADGFVALLLPLYLLQLGFDAFAIGSIITSTLLGSALLTLWVGAVAHRFQRRSMLRGACALMIATGTAFALTTEYWPLVVVAFIGTINPSSGDVSLFLPLEQTVLAQSVSAEDRTALFARYSIVGTLSGGFGVLSASLPQLLALAPGVDAIRGTQLMFALYAVLGGAAFAMYRNLSPNVEAPSAVPVALGRSKHIVYRLMALFALDSFGSGFFVQSMLALWLFQRFGLSVTTTATILFWAGMFAAVSFLIAVRLSERFGLINTMVFTHLPANFCLIALPFAPNLSVAIVLLLLRGLLSQMDVPTRTSYVMAVVTPEERPAAASAAAVPRSLAAAVSPLFAGYLFSLSTFGWPLIIGGAVKVVYDVLLLVQFRRVRPDSEETK